MRRQFNQIGPAFIVVIFTIGCSSELPSTSSSQRSQPSPAESASAPPDAQNSQSSPSETPIAVEAPPGEVVVTTKPIAELPISELLEQAVVALQSGDNTTAYRLSRTAMQRQPDDPQTRFTYALVLGDRKRFPEAIRILDEVAIEMPAAKLPSLGQTAEWMVKFGMFEKAEQRFEQALQLVPEAAMAHSQLAELLIRQGRRIEAGSHLDFLCRSGQIDEFLLRSMLSYQAPLDGDAKNRLVDPIGSLGKARHQIASGDWQQAIETLQESSATDSKNDHDELLGRCFAERSDWPRLEKWNERQRNDQPTNSDGWFARGAWLAHTKQDNLAIDCFLQCILIDPTDAEAYRQLAESLTRNGQTEPALDVESRAAMITKTQTLGNELASSAVRGGAQLTDMVDTLTALRRFDEALAWRQLQIGYAQEFGALGEQQAAQIRNELDSERKRMLAEGQFQRDDSFITCGLKLTPQK